MKQVAQNYKTGKLVVEEVPPPMLGAKSILVQTKASLISAGTERTKVETAKMNIVEKAISRLDLVRMVLNNIKQEGLLFTLSKSFNKLDSPISLGYSCSGKILKVGDDAAGDFKAGDRVACVGENYAAHSELNAVPGDFAVIIPENVVYEEASFIGLGAIAVNAVNLAQLGLKDKVAVIGLGLIGQIVIQLLKTKGCRVLGIEIDDDKLLLADKFGLDVKANPLLDDIYVTARDFSSEEGVDAVIITAASRNNLPIEMAGKISRDKGRVILVGTMPILLPRKEFYEKELYFIISRGFGGGLYYPEDNNRIYPYNYKPSSVAENMATFISLLADNKIDVKPLITHRFNLEEAEIAYKLIQSKKDKYLGIVFNYDDQLVKQQNILRWCRREKKENAAVRLGFIGAGSFAQGYILPILKKIKNVNLKGVATANGLTTQNVARKFGFEYCTTDYREILNDKNIDCVFIMTRHNLHAKLVIDSLRAGKNIFVEKPLCLTNADLNDIKRAYLTSNYANKSKPLLMVGFNRRFSPFIDKINYFFSNTASPLVIYYRINAESLPRNHWVHNNEGGGRVIGEVCHFVDLLIYLTKSSPKEIFVAPVINADNNVAREDNINVTIKFVNGSVGVVNYNSMGDISFSRERIEVFGGNSVAVIDNFNKLILARAGSSQKFSLLARDMGHKKEIDCFISSLREGKDCISISDIFLTTLITLKIKEGLDSGNIIKIDTEDVL